MVRIITQDSGVARGTCNFKEGSNKKGAGIFQPPLKMFYNLSAFLKVQHQKSNQNLVE